MIADIIFEFDRCDGSEPEMYLMESELTPEEEVIYSENCKMRRSFANIEGLDGVIDRVRKYVERSLTYEALEQGNEFVLECIAGDAMNADKLNELVRGGDERAIEFFGFEGKTAEELADWDAHDLEKLPPVYFFEDGVKGPFDMGWKLNARFPEPSEYEILMVMGEEEFKATYRELSAEDKALADEFVSNVKANCDFSFDIDSVIAGL